MTTRVHLASRNAKKIAEMQRILGKVVPDLEVVGLDAVEPYAEPVEDAPTFAGNALIKARAGLAATGMPTLADDSGLCVEELHGMPGVLSARWAGPPRSDQRNNELLLAQLADVPATRRRAHFACAVALCLPAGRELITEGVMPGTVRDEIVGTGGFGYDVLFEAEAAPGRTTAELDPEEKDAISHRGEALRLLAPLAREALTE